MLRIVDMLDDPVDGAPTPGAGDALSPAAAHVVQRRFYRLDDVAEILATTPAQVYALVRRGDLIAMKLGGRGQWRVEQAMLDDYIDRQYEETRAWVAAHPFTEAMEAERARSRAALADLAEMQNEMGLIE